MDLCDYLELRLDSGDTLADCLGFISDAEAVERAGFTESDRELAIESLVHFCLGI